MKTFVEIWNPRHGQSSRDLIQQFKSGAGSGVKQIVKEAKMLGDDFDKVKAFLEPHCTYYEN